MNCAWNEFLAILPPEMRCDVDKLGRDCLQELRLRLGQPPELVCHGGSRWLPKSVTSDDLSFVIHTASRYSPWASATAASGYITAQGGHRIGICGAVVVKEDRPTGIRIPTALCLRVARDFSGIAEDVKRLKGNILILGPPGSGKTTLLRDLIRQISDSGMGSVAVVDERGELFPTGFYSGRRTDVLTGCSKQYGLEMVLRTMGPGCIAVDEITQEADCIALMQSSWCGVRILATAHAASLDDLKRRPIYKALWETKIFDAVVIMRTDKSWYTERIS